MSDRPHIGEDGDTLVSISVTAAVFYAGCCVLFAFAVGALYVCKVTVIDADPAERKPPARSGIGFILEERI